MTQKELDPDAIAFNSNNQRHHFPARFYLPFRGIFGRIDPLIIHNREKRGPRQTQSFSLHQLHAYIYAGSSPTLYVDPLGLDYWVACDKADIAVNPGGVAIHCELTDEDGKTGQPDRSWVFYRVWRDPGCSGRSLDNGINCCCATDEDIKECLKRNPYDPLKGKVGSNCQTNTIDRIAKCCLKTSWKPQWYAGAGRGKCLKGHWEISPPFYHPVYVCTEWEYDPQLWQDPNAPPEGTPPQCGK